MQLAAIAIVLALFASSADAADVSDATTTRGTLQAAFAPWDNVEQLIADALAAADKQILVQAYLLTSKKIAAALVAARQRHIDVRVLINAEQLTKVPSTVVPELASAGIPVWIETKYQNAHNKIIVIDADTLDATVITGSYNFTWTAQHRNAENILIVRNNPALASRYVLNWERHCQEAMPYKK